MPRLWLALFLAALFLADLAWIRADAAPPRMIDDTWHLVESLDLYEALRRGDMRTFAALSLTPVRQKHPPMPKLWPLPLYMLLGPGTAPALYANAVLILVFGLYLFGLARSLTGSEEAAVAAVVLACLFPLTYGLGRLALAEFGQAVATVGALYHLQASQGLRGRRHVALAGLLAGWGLLWKVSFPLFVAGPFCYLLWRRWRTGDAGGLVSRLLLFAVAAAAVAGPFYLQSGRAVVSYLLFFSRGLPGNEYYSLGPPFAVSTLVRYWLSLVNLSLSPCLFLLLAALAAACLAGRRRPAAPEARWFLAAWFVPAFVVLSFQVVKDNRYLLPALPALAIAGAAAAEALRIRWRALACLALAPAYQFAAASFDAPWLPRPDLRWGPLTFLRHDLEAASLADPPAYAFPASRERWPFTETLRAIAGRSRGPGRVPRVRVLGQPAFFSGLNLSYYARLEGVPLLYYSPFGDNYEEPDFLVAADSHGGAPYLRNLLRDRLLPYAEIARFPAPGGEQTRLYERTDGQRWAGERDLLAEAAAAGVDTTGPRIDLPYLYVPGPETTLEFAAAASGSCGAEFRVAAAVMNARDPRQILSEGAAPARRVLSLRPYAGRVIALWLSASEPGGVCPVLWTGLRIASR